MPTKNMSKVMNGSMGKCMIVIQGNNYDFISTSMK